MAPSFNKPPVSSKPKSQKVLGALKEIHQTGPDFDPTLAAFLEERFIPLRWTGVSSRVFSHWRTERLITLPDLAEGREREAVRLTVSEYLQVRMLTMLRFFGMPIEALRIIRGHMEASPTFEEYIYHELSDSREGGATLARPDMVALRKEYEKFFPTNGPGGAIKHLLLMQLSLSKQVFIHVFADGKCVTEIDKQIRLHPYYHYAPRILLDFSFLISELALTLELEGVIEVEGHKQRYSILSENERRILELVRDGKAKSITINFNEQQEPFILEYKRGKEASYEELHQILQQLRSNPYATVEIKTNSSKTPYYQITLKEKLPASGNERE